MNMAHASLNTLAITYLRWLPPFSWQAVLAILGLCLLIWAMVAVIWGKRIAKPQIGLLALRLIFVLVLAAILLGPTIVDEEPGKSTRPNMIYLLDGSQSMNLGESQTRWDAAHNFVKEANTYQSNLPIQDEQWFRFGHRLEPYENNPHISKDDLNLTATANPPSGPDATDSRLGVALRQLLPQVDSDSTAGVVVLSDGRVRDTEAVEELGKLFAGIKVPIHVVPLGDPNGNGDIAIVSLVAPPAVRKFTENEVQVFFRSFGMNGQGTYVKLVRPSSNKDVEPNIVASVPVTLMGGPQSVTLPFRAQDRSEDLVVVIDEVAGELTKRNNEVHTRVEIDRSPLRVLYLQDVANASRVVVSQQQRLAQLEFVATSEPYAAIRDALQMDNEIRCIVLTSFNGSLPRNPITEINTLTFTFPKTRGEMFAFDCIVLSDMSPAFLTEEHSQWLRDWVNERGGGLVITGSKALDATVWRDQGLADLLPLELSTTTEPPSDMAVQIDQPLHPIFQIRLVESLNQQILRSLPQLSVSNGSIRAKQNTEILVSSSGKPVLVTHRSGRGRVLMSTADLTSNAFRNLSAQWGGESAQVASKFWRNIVYWATEGSASGRRRLAAAPDKRFYRPGEQLSIFASAYDERAKVTNDYEVWAMFEPASLEDESLYAPIMWPENVVRESGETSPRIGWGEEVKLDKSPTQTGYLTTLNLSEMGDDGDNGLRIELTAYEPSEDAGPGNHGSQVDSTSLSIQILSDPFEHQNPLPNHQFLRQLASITGGQTLENPAQLEKLLKQRKVTIGPPATEYAPTWDKTWIWFCMLGVLSAEWLIRRLKGMA